MYLVVAVHPSFSSPSSSFRGSSSSSSNNNNENSQRDYRRRRSNHQDWHRSLEGDAEDEVRNFTFSVNFLLHVSLSSTRLYTNFCPQRHFSSSFRFLDLCHQFNPTRERWSERVCCFDDCCGTARTRTARATGTRSKQ